MKIPSLQLTEQDFISQGSHKKCYHYPGQPQACIKIPYNAGGVTDINREVFYLTRVLKNRGPQSGILPRYFGKVNTNFGQGHAFELVRDYDGNISQSIEALLAKPVAQEDLLKLRTALIIMRERMVQYCIISMSIYPENILYQRTGAHDFRLMLINDMGSGAAVPLEYIVPAMARAKIKRYWNRFVNSLPNRIDPAICAVLQEGLSFPTK